MDDVYYHENFCNLAEALKYRTKTISNTDIHEDLLKEFGLTRPLLFVLVDGLGECYLNRLPETSFLRSSRDTVIRSVFPSTTACALTTLATGTPPALHGITGRYSYNREKDLHINTLAFRERFTGKLLTSELKIPDLWPLDSMIPKMDIPSFTIIPEILRHTPFETYLCGSTKIQGYYDIPDAVTRMIQAVSSLQTRAYYFLYIWDLDSIGHTYGTKDERIATLLQLLDKELCRLWENTRGIADMVITADHGQIDSAEPTIIHPKHPIMKYIETIPYGEPRAVQLPVIPERTDEFIDFFEENFGNSFSLHSLFESSSMFGGDQFSDFSRKNFASFIAVAKDRNLLIFSSEPTSKPAYNQGEHGGPLPEERLIPLILPN